MSEDLFKSQETATQESSSDKCLDDVGDCNLMSEQGNADVDGIFKDRKIENDKVSVICESQPYDEVSIFGYNFYIIN